MTRDDGVTAQIRGLGPADVEGVLELERALFGPSAWTEAMVREEMSAPGRWYVGVDRPPTPVRPGPGSSSDVGGALSAPPSAAPQSTAPAVGEGRVATVSSRLLAYAGAWFDGDVVQVMTIGVAPDAQRRGLGAELLDAVLGYARAVGAAAVLLEVRVDNAAAIALYERAGFTVLRRRRRYYQPEDVDAWSMRREL